jgi:hypothetical protein
MGRSIYDVLYSPLSRRRSLAIEAKFVMRSTQLIVALSLSALALHACGGGGGRDEHHDAADEPRGDASDVHDAGDVDDAGDTDGGVDEEAGTRDDAGEARDAGRDAGDAATDGGGSNMDGGDAAMDAGDAGPGLDAGDSGREADAAPGDAALDAGDGGSDAGPDADSGDAATDARVLFAISPAQDRRAISPDIYGVNSVALAQAVPATVVLMGDDETSGYNWELNATNVQDGTQQRNVALGSGSPAARPAAVISAAQARNGLAVLTLPIGDYVAADADGDDVLVSQNYLATRFKQSRAKKGAAFSLVPDTSDDYVYQDEFVNWAKGQAGTTRVAFALDNEPALWDSTHPAFHPSKASYDDVVQRGLEHAKAVKDVWPEAAVSGPVSYGWLEYMSLQGSPDASTKGIFLDYYLGALASASQTDGRRLLDYLDVHWYPEAQAGGVRVIEPSDAADVAAVRVQAPRSLWDDAYREPSWVQDSIGESIRLVPRLRGSIDHNYPGTKLAITAWSYGGGAHISGAVAAADALGIFARHGVDLAVVDLLGASSPFTLAAFRAYLDYDGAGARFGDTSIRAETSDKEASSVYASVNATGGSELVLVALNKRSVPLDVRIAVDGATTYTRCDVHELTAQGPSLVAAPALTPASTNRFDYTMPPMSVVVLVLAP